MPGTDREERSLSSGEAMDSETDNTTRDSETLRREIRHLERELERRNAQVRELELSNQAERQVAALARSELIQADQTIQAYRAMERLTADELESARQILRAQENISAFTDNQQQEFQQIIEAQERSAELAAEELHQKNEALLKILNINTSIGSITQPGELFRRIIHSLTRTLGVERVLLFTRRPGGWKLRAGRRFEDYEPGTEHFAPVEKLIRATRDSRRSQLEPRATLPLANGETTTGPALVVPFILRGELLGLLYCDIPSPERVLHNRDLYVAEIFASQAAIAIKNARLYQQVRRQMVTDGFSRLPNRVKLEHDLNASPGCHFFLLNIDNFSFINGAYGTIAGDIVLKQVIANLRDVAHTLNENYQLGLYRVGPDEFVFLDKDSRLTGAVLHEVVRTSFNTQPVIYGDSHINITFSMGMVAATQKEHLKKASMAVSGARQLGRGRWAAYQADIDLETRYLQDLTWGLQVKRAIEQDRIIPWFQGIHNNQTGKIEKYECLLRMDNQGEIVAPGPLLEAARQTGYFSHLTVIMIDKCFEYFRDKPESFSINFSAEDLNEKEFLDLLENKLRSTGIDPGRVTFEILEGINEATDGYVFALLRRLKAMGFRVAVDDFGKEHSNFSRILAIEADTIKIDGSFIQNIDIDRSSYRISRAIADFAHSMGITVVAEFVDRPEIQTIVKDLGIQYSQGYFFHKPAPEILSPTD